MTIEKKKQKREIKEFEECEKKKPDKKRRLWKNKGKEFQRHTE